MMHFIYDFKNSQESCNRNYVNIRKNIYKRLTTNFMFKGERPNAFHFQDWE